MFLGGSCNPTTWRKDRAIPKLKAADITYFNPQIENWSPELIELEEDAKKAAAIKLFVIDKLTRGISSMVEIAYVSHLCLPRLGIFLTSSTLHTD